MEWPVRAAINLLGKVRLKQGGVRQGLLAIFQAYCGYCQKVEERKINIEAKDF